MRKQELTPQERPLRPTPSRSPTVPSERPGPAAASRQTLEESPPLPRAPAMAAKGSGYPGLICTCGLQMEAGDHDSEVITHRVMLHDGLPPASLGEEKAGHFHPPTSGKREVQTGFPGNDSAREFGLQGQRRRRHFVEAKDQPCAVSSSPLFLYLLSLGSLRQGSHCL